MIELDENVIRLISAKASKIKTYTGRQLKEARQSLMLIHL